MSDITPGPVHIDDGTSAKPDVIAQAIEALTAAARTTRIIDSGTENEHPGPADFAEVACHVITSVAANVGGVEKLLAGRPGSWEADFVRRIVQSTAGKDESELLRYRTEPICLALDVEGTFDDFGLHSLYAEATDELIRQADEADAALFEATATPEEKISIAHIHAQTSGRYLVEDDPVKRAHEEALVEEAKTILEAIVVRAGLDGDPLAATLEDVMVDYVAVELLWEQDQAAYIEAYAATARRALSERGASAGLELLIDAPGALRAAATPAWDAVAEELHQIACDTTPLPMTGNAPDWTDGTPADALRRAGLSYIARVQGKV
jgi:hypothetical protein